MIDSDLERDGASAITKDLFVPTDKDANKGETITRPIINFWVDAWFRLKQNKLAMIGLFLVIVLILLSVLAPIVSKYTYYDQNFQHANLRPDGVYMFGTDNFGRDIYTRIWHGGRISLLIGISAALIDFIIGALYGGISGYKGGATDNIMMRIAEVLYSIPYTLTVILLMVVMGPGILTMIIAMTITGWIPMARLVRGQVLQLKQLEYVQASNTFGASSMWVLLKHLIPNSMAPILINVTLTVPRAIFTEATMGFLGLGVSAPVASWGTMANDALGSVMAGRPYQLFFPAFFISLTMFAFNALGDGLRDALDPKLR